MATSEEILLIETTVQLERFQGKGGWTYARIPAIPQEKKNHFGWRSVKGSIDDYELTDTHLMPMGKGQVFLPVKAEIRKKINKQEGDWVKVILYADQLPAVKIDDFMLCLGDEPEALKHFEDLPETEKKKYTDWIYSAKSEELKIERMAQSIDMLLNGVRLRN